MKNIVILSIVLFTLTGRLHAQGDTTNIQPPPVVQPGQNGTQRIPDQQIREQKEDRTEIQTESLPPLMLNHLQRSEKYKGWEDAIIYFERNTEQYLLSIVRPNSTETFRFDKKGEPIETDKPLPQRETRQ